MDDIKKQILEHSKMPQKLKDAIEAQHDAYERLGITDELIQSTLKYVIRRYGIDG